MVLCCRSSAALLPPFVSFRRRPHLLLADLAGPMAEATVGKPSGTCPGNQKGNEENAAIAMNTTMLSLPGLAGRFVACVVRRVVSVVSLDTTQVHQACPTFARAHGWTEEAERRAQSVVFFWASGPRRVVGK